MLLDATPKALGEFEMGANADAKNGLKDEAIHFTHQEAHLFTHQQRYQSDLY